MWKSHEVEEIKKGPKELATRIEQNKKAKEEFLGFAARGKEQLKRNKGLLEMIDKEKGAAEDELAELLGLEDKYKMTMLFRAQANEGAGTMNQSDFIHAFRGIGIYEKVMEVDSICHIFNTVVNEAKLHKEAKESIIGQASTGEPAVRKVKWSAVWKDAANKANKPQNAPPKPVNKWKQLGKKIKTQKTDLITVEQFLTVKDCKVYKQYMEIQVKKASADLETVVSIAWAASDAAFAAMKSVKHFLTLELLLDVIFKDELSTGAMSLELRSDMVRMATTQECCEGDDIYQEGDPADSLSFIAQGEVEVMTTDGCGNTPLKRTCVRTMFACDFLGETALLHSFIGQRSASIVAKTDVKLFSIHFKELEVLKETYGNREFSSLFCNVPESRKRQVAERAEGREVERKVELEKVEHDIEVATKVELALELGNDTPKQTKEEVAMDQSFFFDLRKNEQQKRARREMRREGKAQKTAEEQNAQKIDREQHEQYLRHVAPFSRRKASVIEYLAKLEMRRWRGERIEELLKATRRAAAEVADKEISVQEQLPKLTGRSDTSAAKTMKAGRSGSKKRGVLRTGKAAPGGSRTPLYDDRHKTTAPVGSEADQFGKAANAPRRKSVLYIKKPPTASSRARETWKRAGAEQEIRRKQKRITSFPALVAARLEQPRPLSLPPPHHHPPQEEFEFTMTTELPCMKNVTVRMPGMT
jgi:hypothetical protein